MTDGNRNVWYLAVVLAVFIAFPTNLQAVSAGAGAMATAVAAVAGAHLKALPGGARLSSAVAAATGMEMCSEVCDECADCDTECFEPAFMFFSTTCGQWDGGVINQHCEGECGDDLCADWAGESCSSCSDDCGPCPDPDIECDNSLCELGETCRNCPEDCSCPDPAEPGDGVCDPTENVETYDCQTPSEFCEDATDCPDYGTTGAVCVDNQCLTDDYDAWAPWCHDDPCPNGFVCRWWGWAPSPTWVCVSPLAER